MRAAHDTFRHLVDHSPFGVYGVNADLQFVQVSASARRTFAEVDPVIGRDLGEWVRNRWPEAFANDVMSRFEHTLQSGEPYCAPSFVERRREQILFALKQADAGQPATDGHGTGRGRTE